jgi:hypothetical protein
MLVLKEKLNSEMSSFSEEYFPYLGNLFLIQFS